MEILDKMNKAQSNHESFIKVVSDKAKKHNLYASKVSSKALNRNKENN